MSSKKNNTEKNNTEKYNNEKYNNDGSLYHYSVTEQTATFDNQNVNNTNNRFNIPEEQLGDYLDAYHLKKGYMLSFNFNKDKEIGIKEVIAGDKVIVEAVV